MLQTYSAHDAEIHSSRCGDSQLAMRRFSVCNVEIHISRGGGSQVRLREAEAAAAVPAAAEEHSKRMAEMRELNLLRDSNTLMKSREQARLPPELVMRIHCTSTITRSSTKLPALVLQRIHSSISDATATDSSGGKPSRVVGAHYYAAPSAKPRSSCSACLHRELRAHHTFPSRTHSSRDAMCSSRGALPFT